MQLQHSPLKVVSLLYAKLKQNGNSAMKKRSYSFRVLLSDDEKDRLQQEADHQGLSMTDIVRQWIRRLPKNETEEIATE